MSSVNAVDTVLSGANAAFLERMYEDYLADPSNVEASWRSQFAVLRDAAGPQPEAIHSPIRKRLVREARESQERRYQTGLQFNLSEEGIRKQAAVARLINHYRVFGHRAAAFNPLQLNPTAPPADLELAYFDLSEADLDQVFDTLTMPGPDRLPLREIIAALRETYCGSIGCEYRHLVDPAIKHWIQDRLESSRCRPQLSTAQKVDLLRWLTAAEGLEQFLHRKYVGQKRFSLEGNESLIPLLDEVVQRAGAQGAQEIIFGMAHRGRLNVLVNLIGKTPAQLFREFEGTAVGASQSTSGDVKYHLGFSSDVATPGGVTHVALAFNPSHLESINPVVEGSVRARQDRLGVGQVTSVLPVLIHGDASFSGQGIIMETLNMAATRGYATGGTLHVVINNQIGFTTSHPRDARSTLYCTDVAYMVQAPVFHVNADDPEAVQFVAQLALDYRMAFQKDVVIDLVGYRRLGHNEADEPAATQPLMYQFIRNHPTVRRLYADRLIEEGVIAPDDADQMVENYRHNLANGGPVARPTVLNPSHYKRSWRPYFDQTWETPCTTAVPKLELQALGTRLLHLPPGFELHARVAAIVQARGRMNAEQEAVDWGWAETLAYATLLEEGYSVRLSGQDSERGTFFHRHAVWYDQHNGQSYTPLTHVGAVGARFQVYNSLLSEAGVLGFEYGYATAEPEALVIWEAQFGDFANGAQVLIDQFISSAEAKWGLLCHLTLLLPHGYEGQGPEHSSARLERYLQLCAEHNIQVCVPSTPAQMFHLLRRQMLRPYRKPLVVMSPKSLLRHPASLSSLDDLSTGAFQPLLAEVDVLDAEAVTCVVLCAGKVYYDLLDARRKAELKHIAIVRVEQLYPFPYAVCKSVLGAYPNLVELVWCQEEPENQGAWHSIKHRFLDFIDHGIRLRYAGRPISAAPAVGNLRIHNAQQYQLVTTALGLV